MVFAAYPLARPHQQAHDNQRRADDERRAQFLVRGALKQPSCNPSRNRGDDEEPEELAVLAEQGY